MYSIYYSWVSERLILISMLDGVVKIDYGDDKVYYRSIHNVEFLVCSEYELIGYFHE